MNGSFTPETRGGRVLVIAFGVLAVLLIGAGMFFWYSKNQMETPTNTPERLSRAEQIIEKVRKLYLLPSKETPTVAELQDVSKVADQLFYKDAKNGDYVLVYESSSLGLIYRPSADKLVTVRPISITGEEGNAAQ